MPSICTDCDRAVERHIEVFQIVLDLQRDGLLPKGTCAAIIKRLCSEVGCARKRL